MMTSILPWKRNEKEQESVQRASVSQMRSDWDRLFDRLLDDMWSSPASSTHGIPIDLVETDEMIRVTAEVPGMKPEDLDISLAGDVLTLSGQKQDEQQVKENGRSYSERHYGSFKRALQLPSPVDPEKVSAEHRHGVVTITLQKTETVRPKTIKVTAA